MTSSTPEKTKAAAKSGVIRHPSFEDQVYVVDDDLQLWLDAGWVEVTGKDAEKLRETAGPPSGRT